METVHFLSVKISSKLQSSQVLKNEFLLTIYCNFSFYLSYSLQNGGTNGFLLFDSFFKVFPSFMFGFVVILSCCSVKRLTRLI